LLEPSWRAISPRGKVLTCGIYQGVAGRVEVRAEYPHQDLIRSELARDLVTACAVAAEWRDVAIARGFEELSSTR
jgi:hypothetical protein